MSLCRACCADASVGAKKKQFTLGTQFKMQLADLMVVLNATNPHFVRCMKPNDLKTPHTFQAGMMLAQLRYAGLLEVRPLQRLHSWSSNYSRNAVCYRVFVEWPKDFHFRQ